MGQMKNFRQLIKELPSSTIVVTEGSFNPPTAKNELQFKLVEKLVSQNKADHAVFVSESTDGLSFNRKTHFLSLMFGKVNFEPLKGSLNEQVAKLKTKYKNVIVVGDSVKGKLAESVQTVPFEEETTKVKSIVSKGDYTSFKNLMPTSFRDIDCKIMFNEMRQAVGLEHIKEDFKFSIDKLRDKYFKGEIYQIGDLVESTGQRYEIMDRGSNYLVVVNETGDLSRKWIKDVSLVEAVKKAKGGLKKACWKGYTAVGLKPKNGHMVPNCVPVKEEVDPNQICYKGYTTKNFHHCSDTAKAFKLSLDKEIKDPVGMLKAIKTTDAYLDLHNYYGKNPELSQIKHWKGVHIKAGEALQKIGATEAHQQAWHKHANHLDKMLEPHYDTIKEAADFGKHNNFNIAKSVMSYQDFMKLNKMNRGEIPDDKQIQIALDPNIKTQIDDLDDHLPHLPHTAVGHTLATDHHLRRRKVKYATEGVIGGNLDLESDRKEIEDKLTSNPASKNGMMFSHDHAAGYRIHTIESGDDVAGKEFKSIKDANEWLVKKGHNPGRFVIKKQPSHSTHSSKESVEHDKPILEGGEVGDQDTKVVKVKNIALSNDIVPKDDSVAPGSMQRPRNSLFAGDEPKKKTVKKENPEFDFNTFKNYRLQRQDK